MLTTHASKRSQQRSLPAFAVELFERYGACTRHLGADVLFMDKAARRRIARDFGGMRALRMVEPMLDAYAVVEAGRVVTLAHRTKRFRR